MGTSWEKIDAAMKARGLTKADLARIAKVSPGAVQKWEQGGRITLAPALLLADALGISAGEILPRSAVRDPAAEEFLKSASASLAAKRQKEQPQLCRFPSDCDLVKELAAHRTAMDAMQAQLNTLTQLLGATLAASSQPSAAHDKAKRAG